MRGDEEIKEEIMRAEAFMSDGEVSTYAETLRAELARREEIRKQRREDPTVGSYYTALNEVKEAHSDWDKACFNP